jgi:hypothetical protein
MAEILYKVGDSGGRKDGDVLTVKPDGYTLDWEDIESWINTGNPPSSTNAWPDYLVRRFSIRFKKIKYLLSHTTQEVMSRYNIQGDDAKERAEDMVAMANHDVSMMQQYGIDTNWGWEDLKAHGVAKVGNLDLNEIYGMIEPERTDDDKGEIVAKSSHKFEYEKTLDSKAVADLRDKAKSVAVDRKATVAVSAFVKKAKKAVKKAM